MEKLIECLKNRKDINIIFSEQIRIDQIGTILTAIKKDYNVEPMLNKKLTTDQLNIILNRMDQEIDTSKINNPALSVSQMNTLIKLLKWNKNNPKNQIDITPFQNPRVPHYLTEQYFNYFRHDERMFMESVLDKVK